MSLTPGVSSPGPAQSGLADVVSQDDLTRWAQIAGVLRYLTAPLEPPAPPDQPAPIATSVISSAFRNNYAALAGAGIDNANAQKLAGEDAAVAGFIGSWAARIVQWCMLHAGTVLKLILAILDGVRKGVDPEVGQLSVMVLNEFLGTDFTQTNLPMGIGTGDHITRARAIGQLFYTQLESEFAAPGGGQVVPATAPAQTFSGLAINFGLASGIMGLIGGLVPIGHVDELRELGEEVARNVGLGRLVRRALTPLIQILVAQPLTWALNTKYLPSQFKEADLVNPFAQTLLPHDQLYPAMHLLGYSDDKIGAFIRMHQKRLSVADVSILLQSGNWTEQDATQYIATLGYPPELVSTVLQVEELRRGEALAHRLEGTLRNDVHSGRITMDEYNQVVGGLPFTNTEKQLLSSYINYEVKAGVRLRPHRLSQGELFYAFAADLITASDLTDRWTNEGLPQADQDTRLQLWLLRLNRLHELEKAKQAQYNAKVIAFGEKQAGTKPGPLPPSVPIPPFPLS